MNRNPVINFNSKKTFSTPNQVAGSSRKHFLAHSPEDERALVAELRSRLSNPNDVMDFLKGYLASAKKLTIMDENTQHSGGTDEYSDKLPAAAPSGT